MIGEFRPQEYARAVLDALHPSRLLPGLVEVDRQRIRVGDTTVPLDGVANITVLGLGKAAVPQVAVMRGILRECLGDAVTLSPSLAITKHDHGADREGIEVLGSGHPLCDRSSLEAGRRLRESVGGCGPDQLILLCLSGGGSALAVEPHAPLTLDDKIAVNRELLRAGAPIGATNLIRQAMSSLKNGGLLRSVRARELLTLVTVDVPSSDLSLVASGPTLWAPRDPLEVIAAARRWLPPVLAAMVGRGLASRGDWRAAARSPRADLRAPAVAIGDWTTLERVARDIGARSGVVGHAGPMEPLDLGIDSGISFHLGLAADLVRLPRPAMAVSGGELTVEVHGQGRGGRNTEFVARFARAAFHENRLALPEPDLDRLLVFSLATDGTDGPTDSAGGWLTRALVGTDESARRELEAALADNDTLSYLERRASAFRTGPTGTNMMDLRGIVLC